MTAKMPTAPLTKARPILSIQHLRKAYEPAVPVLRDVSLDLLPGRVTALLARNGAGKSTAIALIAGRLRPDAGELRFHGTPSIGIAAQETGIYPDLSLAENLRFAGRCQRMSGRQLRKRLPEVLRLFGLEGEAGQMARRLSGGQKRRLHTAMAVIHDPGLILLDEPTVGSDPQGRNFILAAVNELAQRGAAILYTSHYFPEIEALNADIAVLHDGRILARGSLAELIAEYGGPPRVQELLPDLESVFLKLTGDQA